MSTPPANPPEPLPPHAASHSGPHADHHPASPAPASITPSFPRPRATRPDAELSAAELEARSRASLLRLLRVAFLVVFLTIAALSWLGLGLGAADMGTRSPNAPLILILALVLALLVFVVDYFTPRRKLSTLAAGLVGLLGAMIVTIAFSYVLDLLFQLYDVRNPEFQLTIKALVGIALAYLGIATVLQTRDDFRLVIPYIEFAKQIRGVRPLILDSSALIDARIVDVAATGFIQSPILIPRFVIEELQLLADQSDPTTRAKGRRGLDAVTRLQRAPRLDVSIDETPVPGKATDQMLVELARALPGVVVTSDLALAKVASIQRVSILSIHELANALKSNLAPGERIDLRLVRPGEQPSQGVGYLPDGTMVVAEDGATAIGRSVTLVVTGSMQTSAGRLIFARLATPEPATTTQPPAPDAHTTPDSAAAPSPTTTPNNPAPPNAAPSPIAPSQPPSPPAAGPVGPLGPHRGARSRDGSPRNPRR